MVIPSTLSIPGRGSLSGTEAPPSVPKRLDNNLKKRFIFLFFLYFKIKNKNENENKNINPPALAPGFQLGS